jgi:hypothetical protein
VMFYTSCCYFYCSFFLLPFYYHFDLLHYEVRLCCCKSNLYFLDLFWLDLELIWLNC